MNTWTYVLIGILILAAAYFAFAYGKSDSAPPPIARAPQLQAQPSAPNPVQQIKAPAPVANHTVRELTSADEANAFLANGPGILMVYAPWCGHCKNMMPAFETASTLTDVKFARLEGSKAPTFMAAREIRGFPSIFTVSKTGEVQRYASGRDTQSLLAKANELKA